MPRDFRESFEDLHEAKQQLWHGTSLSAAKKILSAGFIPIPKQKVWGDPGEWLASYPGTYFTFNWMTAYSAAGDASRKYGGSRVIFMVQVETRTALPDEDNLPPIEGALSEGGRFAYLNSKLMKDILSSPKYLDEFIEKGLTEYKKDIFRFYAFVDAHYWQSLYPLLREYALKTIQTAAALQKGEWDSKEYNERRNGTPEIRKIRERILQKMRGFPAHTRQGEEYHMHTRLDTSISFRGANKIINAVEIVLPQNQASSTEDNPYVLRPLYGGVPDSFLKEFDKHIGGHRVIRRNT